MSFLSQLTKLARPLVSDQSASRMARDYFNYRFQSFGTMTTLQIDPQAGKISLELQLKGETEPLKVTIDHYEISQVDGKSVMSIQGVQTSREWLTAIAGELAKSGGLKFEIPDVAAAVLGSLE